MSDQIEEKTKLKICVIHDHLGFRGGGERTALLMAIALDADFITAYVHPDTFSDLQKKLGSRLIAFSKKVIQTRGVRFFWLRSLFFANKRLFYKYDVLIASGQTATEIVARFARPKATKIVYTHTTPRRVFDQYESSIRMYKPYLRPFYAVFAKLWKKLYLDSIRKFDFNIANSNCVRERVRKHTGGDANAVIWPPIMTENFKWISQEDYYLSFGRIDEAKRIELIVKAFQKMPDKKLIVASGGPRFDEVLKLAVGYPNIEVLGWVDERKLYELVGRCIASIYIPINEDAGMSHLETNAAGKPFLGVREGGLIESTIEGETGILINKNPSIKDIVKAAKLMSPDWCLSKREVCEKNAKKYDKDIFSEKIREVVRNNNPTIKLLGVDASRWEDPRFPSENRRTGVEVYSMNLIKELVPAAQEKGLRLKLYTPRTINELPLSCQKVIPGKKQWTKKYLSAELKHSPPDYFLTPSYYIPKNSPKNSFAVIHDIIFKSNPKNYSLIERIAQEYALKQNMKRSKRLITISENSSSEIMKYYRLPNDKLFVVPMGYQPKIDINRNSSRENLIIYIGRIEKKKSVDILVKAFSEFIKINNDWKLVLAGKPGYGSEQIDIMIKDLSLQDNVLMPGYIEENKKWELLASAKIFVHPSGLEGSSIPLLEAWDSGIPAIVSDAKIMKELGKDGVLYFTQNDEKSLLENMLKLSSDTELGTQIINKGRGILAGHSWKICAKTIIEMITTR
jgi:glycosyltransferase involved in cell wall biosynthesis